MTDHIPIHPKTIERTLVLLGKLRDYPNLRHEAADLATTLGEMTAIAGEFEHRYAMLLAELLEAVGQTSGRPLDTTPAPASVLAAKAALGEMVPALGNVIPMHAPVRAANSKAEALPPIALVIMVEGQRTATMDAWAVPVIGTAVLLQTAREGERFPRARRARVLDIVMVDALVYEVHVAPAVSVPVPAWVEGKVQS